MKFIIFSDESGNVMIELNVEYGIDFDSEKGVAYFTSADETDYKIPINNIKRII